MFCLWYYYSSIFALDKSEVIVHFNDKYATTDHIVLMSFIYSLTLTISPVFTHTHTHTHSHIYSPTHSQLFLSITSYTLHGEGIIHHLKLFESQYIPVEQSSGKLSTQTSPFSFAVFCETMHTATQHKSRTVPYTNTLLDHNAHISLSLRWRYTYVYGLCILVRGIYTQDCTK